MLTDKFKNLIRYRLALNKYSLCAVNYWDLASDKCVLTSTISYFNWVLCYYQGIGATPLLVFLIYFHFITQDEQVDVNIYKSFGMTFMILALGIVILCSLVVSILKQLKVEVCAFYNACFQLDSRLKDGITTSSDNGVALLQTAMKSCISYEFLLALVVIWTTVPPVFLSVFMFHPCDPLHILLEDVFELKVTPSSPLMIMISLIYGTSCFALCNTFATYIFNLMLVITSCCLWLNAITPTAEASVGVYATEKLGELDCHHVFRIFRCQQLLCTYSNEIVAKFRFTLHIAILHVTVIICSYLIIRNFDLFLGNGAYELLIMLGTLVVLALLMCSMESIFIGSLLKLSSIVKIKILTMSSRKRYSYKVARSFTDIVVNTTYPLFRMSNATFMEFINIKGNYLKNTKPRIVSTLIVRINHSYMDVNCV
ncbi:unnamed protein product [Orchesella dallaii]|uniref:Odorant receptor n=1 Tax=Orchesella dallaii TaxID=48710 RepID=A0ABP1RML4_9HEXA